MNRNWVVFIINNNFY